MAHYIFCHDIHASHRLTSVSASPVNYPKCLKNRQVLYGENVLYKDKGKDYWLE